MNASADVFRDQPERSFIGVLRQINAAAGEEGISVSAIVDRLDERAFGLLILLLTLPCLVPGLPGAQVIAVGIALLALQVVVGRKEPWLPGWFMRMQVKKAWISSIAGFADKRLGWTERFAKPRLTFLATGFGERIAALIMALAAVTVMLPITNTIPSIGLLLLSIGLIQRDGIFTLLGGLVALAWMALLGSLIAGLVMGAGFAVELVAERAPWILDWFGH